MASRINYDGGEFDSPVQARHQDTGSESRCNMLTRRNLSLDVSGIGV